MVFSKAVSPGFQGFAEETPLHLATALGDGHEAAVTNVTAVVCTVPDNLG